MSFETIAKFDTFQFICGTPIVGAKLPLHSGPENLKKSRQKTRESEFLAVLNFFPDQKLIFGHF